MSVRFPFGYGLSYTTFAYNDLCADEKRVRFTLTNTGSVPGAEVAQVYIGKKNAGVFRPALELKGFTKVFLKSGESREVSVALDDKAFRYWNVRTGRWEIEGGAYQIMVGASCIDIRLSAEVEVTGSGAPLPYESLELPSYRGGRVQTVPDGEFAALLGHAIPPHLWDRSSPLELNDTFAQLRYARGWVGRLVYRITKGQLDKAEAAGKPDLDALFRYNMPIRAIAKMTAGGVDMDMARALLEIFNGRFFHGAGGLLSAWLRKGRAEKAAAALAGAEKEGKA